MNAARCLRGIPRGRTMAPMGARILFLALALATTWTGAARARQVEGIEFPDYVEVADWQMPLRLSGAARVSRNYLPVYVVALYVGRARVDAAMLGRGLVPCRFVVHWQTPRLGADDGKAWWLEQLRAQVPVAADRERLAGQFDKLATALGGGARGEQVRVDYHPEHGLRIGRDGAPAQTFTGLELARLVLGLWIGAEVRSDVRAPLLGGLELKAG